MSTEDPPRLSDPASGSSSALREALGAARDDLPAPDELQRLAASLGPLLSGPTGGGGAAGPAAGGSAAATAAVGSSSAISVKLVGLVLAGVVAAAGGGTYLASRGGPARVPRARLSTHAAPVATPAAPSPPPAAPAPQADVLPRAPRPPAPAPANPREEVRMLQEAQDALGASPARALGLAAEHARRFPRGVLAQEREVLAIDALARLGRRDAARQRAERFHARWPGSSHGRRVDALVGAPAP